MTVSIGTTRGITIGTALTDGTAGRIGTQAGGTTRGMIRGIMVGTGRGDGGIRLTTCLTTVRITALREL